jgi:hypothetical protein
MKRKQRVLYKFLIVGVIVIFIGVGVQPAVAVDVKNYISKNEKECDICPKVSKSHIVLVDSLLNRMEKYDTQLSELSKYYPEFEEKYKKLSDIISTLPDVENEDLKSTDWEFPIICGILSVILETIFSFVYHVYNNNFLKPIFIGIAIILQLFAMPLWIVGMSIECWPWWWY